MKKKLIYLIPLSLFISTSFLSNNRTNSAHLYNSDIVFVNFKLHDSIGVLRTNYYHLKKITMPDYKLLKILELKDTLLLDSINAEASKFTYIVVNVGDLDSNSKEKLSRQVKEFDSFIIPNGCFKYTVFYYLYKNFHFVISKQFDNCSARVEKRVF